MRKLSPEPLTLRIRSADVAILVSNDWGTNFRLSMTLLVKLLPPAAQNTAANTVTVVSTSLKTGSFAMSPGMTTKEPAWLTASRSKRSCGPPIPNVVELFAKETRAPFTTAVPPNVIAVVPEHVT